eukprot:5661539-Pleurochrysis_carterae.AAC.5
MPLKDAARDARRVCTLTSSRDRANAHLARGRLRRRGGEQGRGGSAARPVWLRAVRHQRALARRTLARRRAERRPRRGARQNYPTPTRAARSCSQLASADCACGRAAAPPSRSCLSSATRGRDAQHCKDPVQTRRAGAARAAHVLRSGAARPVLRPARA